MAMQTGPRIYTGRQWCLRHTLLGEQISACCRHPLDVWHQVVQRIQNHNSPVVTLKLVMVVLASTSTGRAVVFKIDRILSNVSASDAFTTISIMYFPSLSDTAKIEHRKKTLADYLHPPGARECSGTKIDGVEKS